jgi:hypothetical protein
MMAVVQKSDLTVSMALRKDGAGQLARVHIRKDWLKRAEILIRDCSEAVSITVSREALTMRWIIATRTKASSLSMVRSKRLGESRERLSSRRCVSTIQRFFCSTNRPRVA